MSAPDPHSPDAAGGRRSSSSSCGPSPPRRLSTARARGRTGLMARGDGVRKRTQAWPSRPWKCWWSWPVGTAVLGGSTVCRRHARAGSAAGAWRPAHTAEPRRLCAVKFRFNYMPLPGERGRGEEQQYVGLARGSPKWETGTCCPLTRGHSCEQSVVLIN